MGIPKEFVVIIHKPKIEGFNFLLWFECAPEHSNSVSFHLGYAEAMELRDSITSALRKADCE